MELSLYKSFCETANPKAGYKQDASWKKHHGSATDVLLEGIRGESDSITWKQQWRCGRHISYRPRRSSN
jgi:hypothetical protein